MKFDELNEYIPYSVGEKPKVASIVPYPGITLLQPGRHSHDTVPVGGDFVVVVDHLTKDGGQFTHIDIFQDIERRLISSTGADHNIMQRYFDVITGADPDTFDDGEGLSAFIPVKTFLHAVQCLAVAEHRRYHMHEVKFGGRYLPFRYAAGIHQMLWTAADAAEKQKRGRLGVEWLERDFGVPTLTKELMQ